jgi:hypothetical protein
MKKYLITFIATDYSGDAAFQAIINIDFDLQKEILKCKNDKDFRDISRKCFETNDMKQWLPEFHKDKIPLRILFFQQLYTDQFNKEIKQ